MKDPAGKPEISIIIPVFREGENIDPCLRRLDRLKGIGRAEVIVVDGDEGSTLKAIRRRDSPFRLRTLITLRGRGLQLNTGAASARGQKLVFLHVDTRLLADALEQISTTLAGREAGAFSLGVDSRKALYVAWAALANLGSRLSRVPYGDRVQFIRRRTFERIGGFDNIPLMEDVSLMDKLKARSIPIAILAARVRTSTRRWEREGVLINMVRNWSLYLLYRLGCSPWRLQNLYHPNYDKVN